MTKPRPRESRHEGASTNRDDIAPAEPGAAASTNRGDVAPAASQVGGSTAAPLPDRPRVDFGRDGRFVTLTTELLLPHPRDAVFPFFADAFNLEAITPPLLHFSVLTAPPLTMAPGLRIDYRLRLHGLPLRWQSEISVWEPPHRFVDEQRRGPYRVWIHEHTFVEVGEATLVRDLVRYSVPGGPPLERLFVRPRLAEIFRYRQERIAAIFADGAI